MEINEVETKDQEFEKRARAMLATGFIPGVQTSGSTVGRPTEDEVVRLVEMLKSGVVK